MESYPDPAVAGFDPAEPAEPVEPAVGASEDMLSDVSSRADVLIWLGISRGEADSATVSDSIENTK